MGFRLRLTARVRSADGSDTARDVGRGRPPGLRQTLRVRGIAISYEGPDASGNDISLARPTLADFASTASTALAMFPVEEQPDISLTGDFNWFAPLTGAPDSGPTRAAARRAGTACCSGSTWCGRRTATARTGSITASRPRPFRPASTAAAAARGASAPGLVGDGPVLRARVRARGGLRPCSVRPNGTGDPNDPGLSGLRALRHGGGAAGLDRRIRGGPAQQLRSPARRWSGTSCPIAVRDGSGRTTIAR